MTVRARECTFCSRIARAPRASSGEGRGESQIWRGEAPGIQPGSRVSPLSTATGHRLTPHPPRTDARYATSPFPCSGRSHAQPRRRRRSGAGGRPRSARHHMTNPIDAHRRAARPRPTSLDLDPSVARAPYAPARTAGRARGSPGWSCLHCARRSSLRAGRRDSTTIPSPKRARRQALESASRPGRARAPWPQRV